MTYANVYKKLFFAVSMDLSVYGTIDPQPFHAALRRIQQIISVPSSVQVYVLEHQRYGFLISRQLPKKARQQFHTALRRHTSFSYHHRSRDLIVIHLEAEQHRFLHDQEYLTGLLMHEVMHSMQFKARLYAQIIRQLQKFYLSRVDALHISQAQKEALRRVGHEASFLLKDWYANAELIRRRQILPLVYYYARSFSPGNTCNTPLFSTDAQLHRMLQKDPELLVLLFSFIFSLLSFLVPFSQTKYAPALRLRARIRRCYGKNFTLLEEECRELIAHYTQHFSLSKRFQETFFALLFTQMHRLVL